MEELRLGAVEARFADIVWENAPMTTKELVAICERELNWKRTTTYTVLKKLCERGIFKNEKLKSSLLSFMTNDCLEQLQNVYLVDELRTDTDRRYKNFYLWKNPDSEKYEGVIAIDLDEMIILNHCCAGWYDFKNFISFDYSSTTVRQKQDNRCYKYRMDDLRELIQSGYLSDNNIDVLKKALNYDFPKEMEKLCNKRLMQGKQKKLFLDPIKQLWEYNNQTVGKELE